MLAESGAGRRRCQLAAPLGAPYLRGVPLLPDALRDPDSSPARDADPFGYLRGVLTFLFGGGIVVALVRAATGMSPRALGLAGALWAPTP